MTARSRSETELAVVSTGTTASAPVFVADDEEKRLAARVSELEEELRLAREVMHLGDPERRLIYIPAVPSSGTSLVAGMLANLGVDMGVYNSGGELAQRGYPMYEDEQLFRFAVDLQDDRFAEDLTGRLVFRFRDYLNWRMIQNTSSPVGVKAIATAWMTDRLPNLLPLAVVDVRRDLAKSVASDRRYVQRRAERGLQPKYWVERDMSQPTAWERYFAARAGTVAKCYSARESLLRIHPAAVTLEYEQVLENPETAIRQLIEGLQLSPSEDGLDRARRIVNPRMRHY